MKISGESKKQTHFFHSVATKLYMRNKKQGWPRESPSHWATPFNFSFLLEQFLALTSATITAVGKVHTDSPLKPLQTLPRIYVKQHPPTHTDVHPPTFCMSTGQRNNNTF